MSRINLVENLDFSSGWEYRKAQHGVWALFDLRRNLIKEDADPVLLQATNKLLKSTLHLLSDQVGPNEAAGKLVEQGFVDNRFQVLQFLDQGTPEQAQEQIELHGILAVGFCGLIRAGKSEAGKILERAFGGLHFQFVDSLIAHSYILGFPSDVDRAALRKVNDIIKPRFGNETFAENTMLRAKRLGRMKNPRCVSFDGFRSAEEADLLLQMPRSVLIAIEADMEVRYQRALSDASKKGQVPKSYEDFQKDSVVEEQTMMGHAIKKAQITITNNGTADELYWKIVGVLRDRVF